MWKYIALMLVLVGLSSCGSKKKTVNNPREAREIVLGKQTTAYKSLGNGVAAISLHLYDNNTFKFDFRSIPQPETEEESVVISEKGTFVSEDNWKTLNFTNPEFSLAAIFDPQFGDETYYQVLDRENVKINTSQEMLPIWGVVCEKE